MRRWQIVALSLAACAIAIGGAAVYWFLARGAGSSSSLVAYLPTANASVIYIDVDAMRRSGILDLLAGSKAAEEPDYEQFVKETKFDYRQDLDTVAAAIKDGRVYFALRGRFHWSDLRNYAARQNGSCHNDFCVLTGSQPNRRISFYPLARYTMTRDVMALAVGPDDFAAYQVARDSGHLALETPNEPMWALIPAASLESMDTLPAAARAYMPALRGAEQIVFSVSATNSAAGNRQMQLALHVTCKDAAAARALLAQFEATTKALRELIAHQKEKPDPSDFSELLVAGTFRREERQVYGAWPIPKSLVDAIAGNAY